MTLEGKMKRRKEGDKMKRLSNREWGNKKQETGREDKKKNHCVSEEKKKSNLEENKTMNADVNKMSKNAWEDKKRNIETETVFQVMNRGNVRNNKKRKEGKKRRIELGEQLKKNSGERKWRLQELEKRQELKKLKDNTVSSNWETDNSGITITCHQGRSLLKLKKRWDQLQLIYLKVK